MSDQEMLDDMKKRVESRIRALCDELRELRELRKDLQPTLSGRKLIRRLNLLGRIF